MNDTEILRLLPNPSQENSIRDLKTDLSSFDSITKKLQTTNISLADTRLLFDSILNNFGKKYETLKTHLSENAAVVPSPEFERAIVVSCRGEKLTFSQEEIIKKYIF